MRLGDRVDQYLGDASPLALHVIHLSHLCHQQPNDPRNATLNRCPQPPAHS
jgi:hypothetical protein